MTENLSLLAGFWPKTWESPILRVPYHKGNGISFGEYLHGVCCSECTHTGLNVTPSQNGPLPKWPKRLGLRPPHSHIIATVCVAK